MNGTEEKDATASCPSSSPPQPPPSPPPPPRLLLPEHPHPQRQQQQNQAAGRQYHRHMDRGWAWVVMVASFFISAVVDGIGFSVGVLFSSLKKDFGANNQQVSWVSSTLNGTCLLVGPVVSFFINRHGCQKVALVGCVMTAVTLALSTVCPSIEMVIFVYGFVGGIGVGFLYQPSVVIVGHYFYARRALALGFTACGSGIGAFALSPIFSIFVEGYSWKGATYLAVGFVVLCVVACATFRPLDDPARCVKMSGILREMFSALTPLTTYDRDGMRRATETVSVEGSPIGVKEKCGDETPADAVNTVHSDSSCGGEEKGVEVAVKAERVSRTSAGEKGAIEEKRAFSDQVGDRTFSRGDSVTTCADGGITVREGSTPLDVPGGLAEREGMSTPQDVPEGVTMREGMTTPLDVPGEIAEQERMSSSVDLPGMTEDPVEEEKNIVYWEDGLKSSNDDEHISPSLLSHHAPLEEGKSNGECREDGLKPNNSSEAIYPSLLSRLVLSENGANVVGSWKNGLKFGIDVEGISSILSSRHEGKTLPELQTGSTPKNSDTVDTLKSSNNNDEGMSSMLSSRHESKTVPELEAGSAALSLDVVNKNTSNYIITNKIKTKALKDGSFDSQNALPVLVSEKLIGESCPNSVSNLLGVSKTCHYECVHVSDLTVSVQAAEPSCLHRFRHLVWRPLKTNIILMKRPSVVMYGIACLLVSVGTYVPATFLPLVAEFMKFSSSQGAFLISAVGLGNVVGRLMAGLIVHYHPRLVLTLNHASLLFAGMLTCLLPLLTQYYLMVGYSLLFGACIGTFVVLQVMVLIELVGFDHLTNAFGVVNMYHGIAIFVGAPLAGFSVDTTGDLNSAFYAVGTGLTLAGLICLPLQRTSITECRQVKYSRSFTCLPTVADTITGQLLSPGK